MMRSDAVKPRGKSRVAPKIFERAIRFHEHVLRRVFGFGGIGQKTVAQTQDRAVMFANQRGVSVPVAGTRERKKIAVVDGRNLPRHPEGAIATEGSPASERKEILRFAQDDNDYRLYYSPFLWHASSKFPQIAAASYNPAT